MCNVFLNKWIKKSYDQAMISKNKPARHTAELQEGINKPWKKISREEKNGKGLKRQGNRFASWICL